MKKLILLLTVVLLAGCGKKEKMADIVIWHWMSDREDTFLELAKKYEQETGIRVKFELYAPSEVYTQKIRASVQTNTLPDIYGILGDKRDFASFVKSGHVENLTGEMEAENGKWKKVFFEKVLEANSFQPDNQYGVTPGIYGVGIDMMNIQMLYNKDLFKKAGLDPEKPPRTWEEFLQANKKLRTENIPGLVSGFGEVWLIECLANNFAFNIMGEKKVLDTYRGKVPYTDPDWIKVFELFEVMQKEGIVIKDSITMVNKTAEQTFANNKAAFAFNGSWCINVYKGMNPDLNYAPMLIPEVSAKFPIRIWGGPGPSLVVNAKSAKKDRAIKFLKWLTAKEQQVILARETSNLPANKLAIDEIPETLKKFSQGMNYITHPSMWPVYEFPEVAETFSKGIQSILIGEKTPEQVAREVQNIKSRKLNETK